MWIDSAAVNPFHFASSSNKVSNAAVIGNQNKFRVLFSLFRRARATVDMEEDQIVWKNLCFNLIIEFFSRSLVWVENIAIFFKKKEENPLSKLKKPFWWKSARQKLRKERINRKNAKQLSIDKSFYEPRKHVLYFHHDCVLAFVFCCGSINVSSIAFFYKKIYPLNLCNKNLKISPSSSAIA